MSVSSLQLHEATRSWCMGIAPTFNSFWRLSHRVCLPIVDALDLDLFLWHQGRAQRNPRVEQPPCSHIYTRTMGLLCEYKLLAFIEIQTKCVPVEAAQSMGRVERYHGPLRRAYQIISEEVKAPKPLRLQMAMKAINDTAGPDGLVPTFLVFGTYPRLTTDEIAPSISQRAAAVKKAMKEVSAIYAKRQINEALKTRNGPNTLEIHDHSMEPGSEIMVWREHEKAWKGPYRLLKMDGETCTIEQQTNKLHLQEPPKWACQTPLYRQLKTRALLWTTLSLIHTG